MADIVIKNVRLSFNDLHSVSEIKMLPNGDEMGGKYRAVVLLDKADKKQLAAIKAHVKEAIENKWGTKPPKIKAEKLPFKDGDEQDREEQEGHWVITASEKPEYKPVVVGRKNEVLTADSGLPYSGCVVNIRVRAYAYDSPMAKGVAFSLKAVQFVRDGEPLGVQRLTADDAFEELEDEDEDNINDLLGGGNDDDIPL